MTQLSIRKMKEAPGEEMLLNMGPQHPSTHGVINFLVETDGEVITRAIPDVGYLHRAIEKIAEKCSYHGFMPYTDRVDYVAAMSANEGWARAVEKLLKIEVPPRGEYARVIAVELGRISSHLVALGSMAMDIGASTPFIFNLREREYINDLLEELCGARLTFNYFRIGGVMADLPAGFREKTLRFLDHFEPIVEELHRLVGGNEILVKRFAGVGTITGEEAIAYGLVGPNLRASGVDWDLRRDLPYGAYPDFDFDVAVGTGRLGELGDCLDRWDVRITEMLQSARIVRQAFDKLPEGPVNTKVPRKIKTKPDEVQSRVESARGEMAYYIVAGTGENPWRVRIRTGSFTAMTIIESKSPGMMLQDLVAFFASLDVVAPEVDR